MHRYLIVASAAALLAACSPKPADNTAAASDNTTTTANTSETNPASAIATDNATATANTSATTNATTTNETTAAAAPAAADFLKMAASSDMFEIAAAKLALTKATSKDVKDFAAMMIRDHTKSTMALKAAIAQSGQTLPLPKALPDDMKAMITDLTNIDANAFDKAYMDGQIAAHQNAAMLLTSESQSGDTPALKDFATMILPTVKMHLAHAMTLRPALH